MSKSSRVAGPLLGALALCCCSGAAVTYGFYAEPRYTPSELGVAASQGPVPVTIRGNPFAATDARLSAAVVTAMQGSNFGAQIEFTDQLLPPRYYDYRIVMAFDQPPQQSFDLCAPLPPVQPAVQGGAIHAKAAFCLGHYRYTEIQGSIAGASGPDDPRFRALIKQLTLELLPANDPTRFGNDCGPGEC